MTRDLTFEARFKYFSFLLFFIIFKHTDIDTYSYKWLIITLDSYTITFIRKKINIYIKHQQDFQQKERELK